MAMVRTDFIAALSREMMSDSERWVIVDTIARGDALQRIIRLFIGVKKARFEAGEL
jgi:hypothetical protein